MGDVTHTPHSFYISRYPPGREATVFDGEIELAFSNDYPTGVLIETIWTDSDITVRLWGTKHVEVESVTSDRFNYTSPAGGREAVRHVLQPVRRQQRVLAS